MITCTFENGNKTSLRHVTVGAIVINDQNQFLLEKRASSLTNGNKYCLPSGFVDRDETMQEAIIRELKEETGLEGKVDFLFRLNDNPKRPKEDRQNVDIIYVVKVIRGRIIKSDEVSEVSWFREEDLPTEEEFAFDHRENIMLYIKYQKARFSLPIIGTVNI